MIAKKCKPSAGLEPLKRGRKLRFGVLKGKIRYPDDFDAPLPPKILALFTGRRAK